MKIILFVGIFALLVQNISCQCQAFLNGNSCCASPPGSSCCFDQDKNCCVDNNDRCEGGGQGGGRCQAGELVSPYSFKKVRETTEKTE